MNKTELYRNLQLLGYKINELSTGDFLAQRPNKEEVLFNPEGEHILGNLKDTVQISKEIFAGIQDRKLILFNRKGNILDETLSIGDWNEYLDTLESIKRYIIFPKTSSYATMANVYSEDGKHRFNSIKPWRVNGIINIEGTVKLVLEDADHEDNILYILDTQGNADTIEIEEFACVSVNNHFILTRNKDTEFRVLNLEGVIVHTGNFMLIDEINLDNDTVISVTDNYTLSIQSELNNLSLKYKTRTAIRRVEFTCNTDIILIREREDIYLLNIKTLERTNFEFKLANTIENIVISTVENDTCTVAKIDWNTFEITEVIKCNYCVYNSEYIIIGIGNTKQYYTLELKPLIREFNS